MVKSAIKCYVNITGTYNEKNAGKTQKWSYFGNSYVNVTWTFENYYYIYYYKKRKAKEEEEEEEEKEKEEEEEKEKKTKKKKKNKKKKK